MKFVSYQSLFLVWTVPVLLLVVFYGARKRKKILARFSTAKGLQSISPEADAVRRWFKSLLLLGCLFFSAIAVAGPQYGFEWEEVEQKGVDIILAVDCSRSMLAEDVSPSRLNRAKMEILDLLSSLKGDRVGLVAFAGTAFLQCPLTLDYDGFHIFLDVLTPGFLPVGGTNLSAAIKTALSGFETAGKTEKAIILITDGESTEGNAAEAAEAAAEKGVKLFCIGVGRPEGVPVPDEKGGFKKDPKGAIVLTKLDENTLRKIAILTGGAYVRSVAGDMDLDLIYEREIRGKMKSATFSAGKKKIWQNRYQWALFFALAAFCIELLISSANHGKATMVLLSFLLSAVLFLPAEAETAGVYENMKKGLEAYDNKDFEKAMEHFIQAQLNEPDDPKISYNLGAAYYKTGDFKAAADNFSQALKSQSQSLKAKSFYNLGNANFRLQNYQNAIENYESALKISPDDREAAANLALTKRLLEQQQQHKNSAAPNQSGKKKDHDKGEQNQRSGAQKKQEHSGSNKKAEQNRSVNDSSLKQSSDRDRSKETSESGESNSSDPPGKKNEDSGDKQAEAKAGNEKKPQSEAMKAESVKDKNGMQRIQAETMLNRLEDKPGKAMMPAYGETRVQMDW